MLIKPVFSAMSLRLPFANDVLWFAPNLREATRFAFILRADIKTTRPGRFVSYAGVPHGVGLNGEELFFTHVHMHDGPAPVRRYLPHLIDLHQWSRGECVADVVSGWLLFAMDISILAGCST